MHRTHTFLVLCWATMACATKEPDDDDAWGGGTSEEWSGDDGADPFGTTGENGDGGGSGAASSTGDGGSGTDPDGSGGNVGDEGAGEDSTGSDAGATDGVDVAPLGVIRGRVCSPRGDRWIAGASVSATVGSLGFTVEDITDAEGKYALTELPIGETYTISIVKGSFSASHDVTLEGEVHEMDEASCVLDGAPNLAVVTGDYDHIEDIISAMELGYTAYDGTFGATEYRDFLTDPTAMAEYDIIFFNCGVSQSWLTLDRGIILENIVSFLENGGSIYVSDWAYYFVELPFPDQVDFYGNDEEYGASMVGGEGAVDARVVDPILAEAVGSDRADINLDLPMWAVPESSGEDARVLVEAEVTILTGFGAPSTLTSAPLAVEFDVGERGGRAIYTAFHNEHAATTADMVNLLEEFILRL